MISDIKASPSTSFEVASEGLAMWLSATSLTAVALLCAGLFDPLRAASGGLFFTFLFLIFRPSHATTSEPANKGPQHTAAVLALVALAVFFRSDPYLWVGGGQDQGLYVSMASHYAETGGPFIHDTIREKLDEELTEKYDRNNIIVQDNADFIAGKYEGKFLPGIYVRNLKNSQYVFQFYPVHPLWMAIFRTAFGEFAYSHTLPFFGVLSILFFYLVLQQATNHRTISLLGAGLLCISPSHAFFSKFPTSEVVSLTFLMSGIYFLLRGIASTVSDKSRVYFLFLSTVSFASMFFTHINGFMFIPAIVFGYCYCEIFSKSLPLKNSLRCYFLALICAYGTSVVYGLFFSFPYSFTIYDVSFSSVLGDNWGRSLLVVSVALASICGICFVAQDNTWSYLHKRISQAIEFILGAVPLLLLAGTLVSCYLIYQLAVGTPPGDEIRFTEKWPDIAGTGLNATAHWSLFVFASHLSPGIAIFLIFALVNGWKERDIKIKFFGLGATTFFLYIAILKWFVPYQYYFVRYQLSQLLPLALLVAALLFHGVMAGSHGRGKKLFAAILVISAIPYSLAITSRQFGFEEQAGLLETLKTIENEAGADSVVLIDSPKLDLYGGVFPYPYAGELKTSLMFHTSLKPISVTDEDKILFANFLCSEGFQVSEISAERDSFSARQLQIFSPLYARMPSIFLKKEGVTPTPIFVERINCNIVRTQVQIETGLIYDKGKNPHAVVTGLLPALDFTGEEVVFELPQALPGRARLEVETLGFTPEAIRESPDFVRVYANEKLLDCSWDAESKLLCDLADHSTVSKLAFKFRLWQPLAQGINLDTNFYGLDIKSVRFVGER